MEHCIPKPRKGEAAAPTTSPAVSLPVLPAGADHAPGPGSALQRMRRSRVGWIRALVLTGVTLFMVGHVVQWLAMGVTLAPIEPSESMQTIKDGVITVGAVFFGAALLATAILGRWFCGWGCHWVGIQDGTAWLLRRVGIRPKPFRSRLLMWVPLLLALYMFVWPLFYRFAIAPVTRPDLRWPGFTTHFFTDDFWATFPGLVVGVPFVLVSGAFIIYLLGSKGYCTYGCPYGGFFAPVEELAPMRIVVDADKCHTCGHCTAVCSSNVRVHEEVRDYGMVVDPGCMKCLDCVSVCPNEALRFGVGKPSLMVKREGTAAAASTERRWDLTWPEEIALATLALFTFLAVRGPYFGIPLLFASGLTVCVVFLAWKSWRVLSTPNAAFHAWQLRFHGRVRPAGAAWLALTVLSLLAVVYVGGMNLLIWRADDLAADVTVRPEVVFSDQRTALPADMAESARAADSLYALAAEVPKGLGILPGMQQSLDLRRASLLAALGQMQEAEQLMRASSERSGMTPPVAAMLARIVRSDPSRQAEAIALYDRVLAEHPDWQVVREEQLDWLQYIGELERSIRSARDGLKAYPDNLLAMRRLSLALMEHGATPAEWEEGVAITRRTIEIEPNNGYAHAALARGLLKLGRKAESIQEFKRAVELEPNAPLLRSMLQEVENLNEGENPMLER
ncbi:MAG: 4Fe-4S binding protein [Phycisphaerales bacterium]